LSPDSEPSDADLLADSMRLSMIAGIGPHLRKALLDEFGTPRAVLRAAPAELRRVPGIDAELTRHLIRRLSGNLVVRA
jgi:excinuclease UvrABC nuclease subunit